MQKVIIRNGKKYHISKFEKYGIYAQKTVLLFGAVFFTAIIFRFIFNV